MDGIARIRSEALAKNWELGSIEISVAKAYELLGDIKSISMIDFDLIDSIIKDKNEIRLRDFYSGAVLFGMPVVITGVGVEITRLIEG